MNNSINEIVLSNDEMIVAYSMKLLLKLINDEISKNVNHCIRQLEIILLKCILNDFNLNKSELFVDGLVYSLANIAFCKDNIQLLNIFGWKVYTCLEYDYKERIEYTSYMLVAPGYELENHKDCSQQYCEYFYGVFEEMKYDVEK